MRADETQRAALQSVFSGQVGGRTNMLAFNQHCSSRSSYVRAYVQVKAGHR
jgi:hypothetical protein